MRGDREAMGTPFSNMSLVLVAVLLAGISFFLPAPARTQECFTDLDVSKEELEDALEDCRGHIERTEATLRGQQRDRTNVEYDILLIDNEINKALLRIRSSDVAIGNLGEEISDKSSSIDVLLQRLEDQETVLTDILQKINETEQKGFLSLVLLDATISSFFTRSNEYDELRQSLERSLVSTSNLQRHLEANVAELESKKLERYQTRQQQQVDAERVKQRREEKEEVLEYHLAVEEKTKEQITVYEDRAHQISNRLFQLRGTGAIPFEEALRYAQQVSRETGVRPAFLLGLIKHESDLGRNVGRGTYRADMHPTRDQPIFPFIADLLDLDPEDLPVSANPGFGWGGAMGPAQFIPSTWTCFGGLVHSETGTCNKNTDLIQTASNLEIGSRGNDVRRLQQFLNEHGFTVSRSGAGSPGNETSVYGPAVAAAVSRFQERYANRILRPYGYTRGTGTVGPSTRKAINELNFYSGPWEYDADEDVIRDVANNQRPSNPWNPRDAFFASGIYLERLGADRDECTAARRYYAGGNWRSAVARNYCSAVLSNAISFQRDIDFLSR